MIEDRVEVQLQKPTGHPVGHQIVEVVEDAPVHVLVKGAAIAAHSVEHPRSGPGGKVHLSVELERGRLKRRCHFQKLHLTAIYVRLL